MHLDSNLAVSAAFGLFTSVFAIGCTNQVSDGAYLVQGTATGLNGSTVVLRNNGGDDLTIATDGEFTFAQEIVDGAPYAVTLAESTRSVSCELTHASGVIDGHDATDVALVCTHGFSVGGSVTGLTAAGLILENNHRDAVTLTHDGTFVFDGQANGDAYEISISQNPDGETCTVQSNGSGTIAKSDVTNVSITCAADDFHLVRGLVNGLTGGSLLLQNGTDAVSVASNGEFHFPQSVARGFSYAVLVVDQVDTTQSCSVANGAGTMSDHDIVDIEVDCTN